MLSVVLDGANLCTTTIESPATITSPVPFGGDTPESHIEIQMHLNSEPLVSDTYSFDVNRGAAAGTLAFVAGEPDGFLAVSAPSNGATMGADPTFTVFNDCSNCQLESASLSIADPLRPMAATPDGFVPPFHTLFDLSLVDLVGAPPELADGSYGFETEAIAGALVLDQTFAGDPSGVHFLYLSGTSNLLAVDFTVPEPAALA